ncbi:hypothetical protein OG512_48185 [Streptomyces sp. NBC_01378]|uniref:hypothetical protein n=1 Tax=Streptomyces sp. NBC_01378 TaxID=2903844 RepID=UPI0032536161
MVATGGPRTLVAVWPPFREALTLGPIVDAARRAFAELLDRLGIDVLVVEDVHWADEATLEFLLFLASRQPFPLTLVMTCRPEEVAADSLLLRLSSRAPTGAGISHARVGLTGLAVSDTAELLSSMLDDEHVSTEFATFLHDRTEGVPLALEECVRLLRDRADLVRRDGEWMRRTLDEIAVRQALPAEFTVDVRHRFGAPWTPLSAALPRRSFPAPGSGCPTGPRGLR